MREWRRIRSRGTVEPGGRGRKPAETRPIDTYLNGTT